MVGPPTADHPGIIEKLIWESLQAYLLQKSAKVVLSVSFDGRSITYGIGELDALVPAYGASIHKSQGSECPAVVIPVMTQHYAMLQRNLLYTAVTRGKRLVLLVGLPDIMHSRHASTRPRSAIPCSFDQRRRPETLRTAIATLLHRATMVVAALFGETFRLRRSEPPLRASMRH